MRVTATLRGSEPTLLHLQTCGPAEAALAALASRITQGSAGMTPSPGQGLGDWDADNVRLPVVARST